MRKQKEEQGSPASNLALVFGYIAIKELKTLEERVAVLARLGYKNAEIAKICGTTPLSVSVRKAGLNKGKRRKPKSKSRR
jgi:DNA-binding NarL/FixJ family response regulator